MFPPDRATGSTDCAEASITAAVRFVTAGN
jgi:hypothetical protein